MKLVYAALDLGLMGCVSDAAEVARIGCDDLRDRRSEFREAAGDFSTLGNTGRNIGKSADSIVKDLTSNSNNCVRITNAIYKFKSKIKSVLTTVAELDETAAHMFTSISDSFECMNYVSLVIQTDTVTENSAKSGGLSDTQGTIILGSGGKVGSRLGTAGTDGELKTIDGVFCTATGKNGGKSANLNPATQQYIYNMCQETGMDYPLAFAMWYCENTAYESNSKSKGGTMGLTNFYINNPSSYTTFRTNYGEEVDKLIQDTWKKTYGEGSSWDKNSFGEGTIYYDMAVSQAALMTSYSYKDSMYEAMRTYCGGDPSIRFKIANELRAQMGWEQVDYATLMSNASTQTNFL